VVHRYRCDHGGRVDSHVLAQECEGKRMNEQMIDDRLLHEMPIALAFWRRLLCLFRGGHKYGDVERIDCDEYRSCSRVCVHCRHMKWWNEPIEE